MNEKALALLRALRAKGVDSTDVRHAVHEASHALDAKMRVSWSNDFVAVAMRRIGPGRAARSEVLARAVEQIVCQCVGIETRPLEHWIGTSVMEAIKFRDPFLSYEDALKAAREAMGSKEADARATEILALVEKKRRARRKGSPGEGAKKEVDGG